MKSVFIVLTYLAVFVLAFGAILGTTLVFANPPRLRPAVVKPPEPPPAPKLCLSDALRVERAMSRIRVLQKEGNDAAQDIAALTQSAIQPLIDEVNDIGAGKFTVDEVYDGRVKVNVKTGEIKREPVKSPETKK